jgi:2-dehydropantoate 2-reductase
MRLLIVGAGGVGLGLASALLQAGEEVAVVARGEGAAALRDHGLCRTGILGRHQAAAGSFAVYPGLAAVPPLPYDCVLICVKSFDSAQAADELALASDLVDPDTRVVLFQNGFGNLEAFAGHFPVERLFLARVITGFRLVKRHQVEVTVHAAPVLIGSPLGSPLIDRSEEMAPLSAALTRGGLPAAVSHRIDRDLWAKLLYNAMLNPLGALFDATYGELGASAQAREIMERIATEGFAVLSASGRQTHWSTALAFLEAFYAEMLPPTRAHPSSMLQDIRQGRRTEVDSLNGAVVSLGREHGVATPVNELMVALVHLLESRPPDHPRRT